MGDPHAVRGYLRFVGTVVRKLVTLEKPTIAAVNGPALGGGCNLALACDLVLCPRGRRPIGQVYAQRALVPDMGGTYFLPRLVGRARAFELAYFGDSISAADAAAMGLVNRSVPGSRLRRVVRDWAERLAAGAGRALGLDQDGAPRLTALRPRRRARMGSVRDRDDLPDRGPARIARRLPREAPAPLRRAVAVELSFACGLSPSWRLPWEPRRWPRTPPGRAGAGPAGSGARGCVLHDHRRGRRRRSRRTRSRSPTRNARHPAGTSDRSSSSSRGP